MSLLPLLLGLLIPIFMVMKVRSRAYMIFGRKANSTIVRRFNRHPGILLAHALFIASFQIITICFYAIPEWSKANNGPKPTPFPFSPLPALVVP
jgi:hypothetical protein